MLEKEYKFYQKHQADFLKKYNGKVLVIVGEKVVGVYNDEVAAYEDATAKYQLGTFLIQKCSFDGNSVQTFHSRVIYS
jgi:hypothetical protein